MKLAWVLAGWAASVWAAGGPFDQALALKKAERFAEAAALFSEIVRREPRNADALEQLAILQGWLDKHSDAVTTWRRLLGLAPKNDDYRLGLARVLYWRGDLDAALSESARVVAARPRSAEALALRGDILAAAGRIAEARAVYGRARAAGMDPAEAAKKLSRLVVPLRWRVDAGFIHDNYTNFRRAERGTYLQAGWSPRPGEALWLKHEWQRHFGSVDNPVSAGGVFTPRRGLALSGDVGGTPRADFSPDFKAGLGADWRASPWAVVSGGYRYASYGNGSLHSFVPGLRVEPAPWVSLEYRLIHSLNIDDSSTQAHLLRLGFSVAERLLPYVGFASGEEAVPPQPKARSNDVSAGVVWNASRAWALRVDYANEHRPGFYERNTVGGGTTYRF